MISFVAEQAAHDFSYSEVGATRGEMPAGYRHDRWSIDLDSYLAERFDLGATALRSWAIQRGAGLAVFPGGTVEDGSAFGLVYRLPFGGYVRAAGRIVYLINEPGRSGFAYGTLPGHPEQGEEAFLVVRRGDRLLFEIMAFSRPRHWLARVGSPVTRMLQLRATRGYIAAMRKAIDLPHR